MVERQQTSPQSPTKKPTDIQRPGLTGTIQINESARRNIVMEQAEKKIYFDATDGEKLYYIYLFYKFYPTVHFT